MFCPVAPLLQTYVPPPVAVIVEAAPGQMLAGLAAALAEGLDTLTTTVAVAVQPAVLVTVTV